ncbi:MAG: ATP-binding protein [Gemmatimonadetes bacterium]|nr:ATP-binding protein [Gemmatimonadota bacterium]
MRAAAERAGSETVISVKVPTDLEVVEEAVDVVARHCLASGLNPKAARFNLRVALSEALANAIVYGNGLDPTKSVEVRVVIAAPGFSVHVCDEGPGFDPSAVPDPTLPDRIDRPDGRGLFLIRKLVDDVSFNDRGNAICMTLRRA